MANATKIRQAKNLREIAFDRCQELLVVAQRAKDDTTLLSEFKCRYKHLETIYSEFERQHACLISLLSQTENADVTLEKELRITFDKNYYQIQSLYTELIEKTLPNVGRLVDDSQSKVKLPKLTLPIFEGCYKSWPMFLSLYNSSIHNNKSLSNGEKYQYLISQLQGEPLNLVKSLPCTDDNYLIAYNTLFKRYQNKRRLASAYWDEINNLAKLTMDSPQELRHLLDIFSENLLALEKLGFETTHWDFILFHVLIRKIDGESVKRFELQYETNNPNTDIPTFKQLKTFLEKQCSALTSADLEISKRTQFTQDKTKFTSQRKKGSSYTSSFAINTDTRIIPTCRICNTDHFIYKCPYFLAKSPSDRYAFVKQNNLCLNCLLSNHGVTDCTSQMACKLCNRKHHSLLHFDTSCTSSSQTTSLLSVSEETEMISDEITGGQTDSEVNALTSVVPCHTTVLLSTANVEILDAGGNFQTIRVLLDSASQASFISEKCYRKLGLRRFQLKTPIHGLGQMSSKGSSGVTCTIRPLNNPNTSFTVDAIILPQICSNLPSSNISINDWNHITNLKLADNKFHISGPIDMLLGADIFSQILLEGRFLGGNNQATAINTVFGWILLGKVSNQPEKINSFFTSVECTNLDRNIRRFWEVEEIPRQCKLSSEDLKCEDMYKDTYSRNNTGRYVVALPFRDFEPNFVNTRSTALRRFYSLERRLLNHPNLYIAYSEFMKDYLESGHMNSLDISKINSDKSYYIPHHCVLKPESSTTKLRVVFDASSKSSDGTSLNDTLLVGPKLQQNIVKILLNFRIHMIVLTADIKQMYRQILITPRHRDYQRILWRFSVTEPVQDYRLNTVTFGVSSAPFLAIRTLHQLAQDGNNFFPLASKVLLNDTYVDDIITGCNSLSEAKTLQANLIALLNQGGFQLRKWASNDPRLLENIPFSDRQNSLCFNSDNDYSLKILGLKWNPVSDCFSYNLDPLDRECTKRTILSELARIFDPLGFLTPLTFLAKFLIQQLWALGLQWDEKPPTYILKIWNRYKIELSHLLHLSIPRRLTVDNYISCEVHGFCDSSEKGYGAVIYFRYLLPDQTYKIYFVCAKSKVAPLKKISLPRLELCGAVLLSDLFEVVLETYSGKMNFNKLYVWTDSTIVLHWVKSSPHRWKTFVSNRVAHIQEKVSPENWHHVISEENPADCASRGLFPSEIISHSLWWNGPTWLLQPQQTWRLTSLPPENFNEEEKVTLVTLLENKFESLLDKFSSLSKIKRILSYCIRFCHNVSHPKDKRIGPLTSQDLCKALLILVKHVQSQTLGDEILSIQRQRSISKSLRKLSPFLDDEGILRVGGRLVHSSLPFNQKHPILLIRKHRLTELIIQDIHDEHLHPGVQTLHYLLRQNFWILNPKCAIRTVISRCYKCFRVNPIAFQPPMGNLPHFRVSKLKPFSCVGVDFGGPFTITLGRYRGAKTYKSYLCLFVCCATKAVHLELVSDLSRDAFLAALRRFISRRGRCTRIHSDCGTNFVAASKFIADIMQHAVESEKIDWRFIPPSAPHFGGLWEAGIKSVKNHLIRLVGDQILTYEELYTVFTQIEALLNSRPLSPISSDPNDLTALSPGHFLTLEPLTTVPDDDLTDKPTNRLNRWQLLQRLHQVFWKRWRNEYLHTLMQRQKWNKGQNKVNVGTLVVINEPTSPIHWRLGRIIATHLGSDGVCRVATVKTAQGTFKRPIVKLCPLPVQ